MFRTLLVPTDTSVESATAEQLARQVARATGGTVKTLAFANVESSASRILSAACLEQADLIVLGMYGDDPLAIVPSTSLAHEVVLHSPCPVLVAPATERPFQLHTLLVPVDGTPGGSLALAAARALAESCNARLVLVDVVVPVPAVASATLRGMTVGGYIDPDWDVLALNAAREYVDSVSERLRDAGLEVETHVATGSVGETIIEYAQNTGADAIVMSTHSVEHTGPVPLGSVADYVLRNTRRPVLLVKREPRPE